MTNTIRRFVQPAIALIFMAIVCFGPVLNAEDGLPTTRDMNLMTWTEFQEVVPAKINTVLLPIGSIEPHGVIPSGTDSLAPSAMAVAIAVRLNSMIAPTLNYGITPAMKAYPGAVSITSETYAPFITQVLEGLADNHFLNIIVLNGHGGNTATVKEAANKVSSAKRVRILVVNWWSLADDITKEVFGENGGHAGNNETAYVQAIVPKHIHPERYSKEMATPNALANSYYAVPVASSIGLYEEGQGYPTFDSKQAEEYFKRVNDRVAALVKDIIKKWDLAGLYLR
jgi:creatinine amidohydrolase